MQTVKTDDIPVSASVATEARDSFHHQVKPAASSDNDNDKKKTSISSASAAVSSYYNVVALDLDGTLLQSNHTVSDETVNYLRYLHSRGMTIIIATGRAAPSVYSTIIQLNFPRPVPVVCSNGSKGLLCMPDAQQQERGGVHVEELFSVPVPKTIVEKTLELATTLDCVVQYYHANDIYANPYQDKHYELTRMYSDLTGAKTIFVKDNFRALMQSDDSSSLPSKLLVLAPSDELGQVWTTFQDEFHSDEATLVYGSMGWFLEVLHPNVCKGNGLEQICHHRQFQNDIKSVVSFGDGDNDLEFIQRSGRGIVMKNGRDVVKEVADEVIEYSNDEDGVRKTLQRMEKEGLLRLN